VCIIIITPGDLPPSSRPEYFLISNMNIEWGIIILEIPIYLI